ncbi:hypothetical protein OCHUTO_0548 [Orientia chuto str. Dubai]|uniref:Uncharacterized protein n=1 Tax=Orientia chuto str. Dubai TaxID=1359168 RepID=A0A0F3MKD6_9RICK|nr:hypothetical protein [Candidatus Orientia mediorientalis]KJV56200.1 hypothetical protein OCHUTO_0548 [Orientia chuto str. Dubai]
MAKALANELRDTDKADSGNFKFNDIGNLIKMSPDPSKEGQLKLKLALSKLIWLIKF